MGLGSAVDGLRWSAAGAADGKYFPADPLRGQLQLSSTSILAREPSFTTECLRDIARGNLPLPAVTLPAVSGAGPAG